MQYCFALGHNNWNQITSMKMVVSLKSEDTYINQKVLRLAFFVIFPYYKFIIQTDFSSAV